MCETSKAPAVGPNSAVLLDDARVLDGHLVAGEGHHARAERDVALVERRARERRGLHGGDSTEGEARLAAGSARPRRRPVSLP